MGGPSGWAAAQPGLMHAKVWPRTVNAMSFEKSELRGLLAMNMQTRTTDRFVQIAAMFIALAVVIEIAARHIW
jgi:hypothetical protein